ncbi:class I SAM-dependent methyltransferase [Acidobacteriota bacterium]
MNKKNFIGFVLLLTLCALFVPAGPNDNSYAQNQQYDDWEKKVNAERQPPEQVMDALGIKPGMVIGEVGAGRGRYTVHLAKRVGDKGKIYANDISETALDYLRQRISQNKITNIEIVSGKIDDPLLPERSLDMAIMIWVFHMMDQPIPMMKNLTPSLKPGAPIVIIAPPDYEIDEEIKEMKGKLDSDRLTIKQRIEKAAEEAGLEITKILTFLPKDSIFFLKAKDNS